jgi:hypothetical protein
MERGDIYLVSLDPASGHEQQGTRPVLLVSPGPFTALHHSNSSPVGAASSHSPSPESGSAVGSHWASRHPARPPRVARSVQQADQGADRSAGHERRQIRPDDVTALHHSNSSPVGAASSHSPSPESGSAVGSHWGYTLDDLLAQCDPTADPDSGDGEWLEAAPTGDELL